MQHERLLITKERENGQGLVEYALILALVAVVAIAVLGLIGFGIQRVYGLIGAAMGAEHDTSGAVVLQITTAQCVAVQSSGLTGLWVVGVTNVPVSELVGSTEMGIGTGMGGAPSPVTSNGPGTFRFNPLLANSADLTVCPRAVVVQSSDGAITLAPVEAVLVP
jgi:pilus assembly protein Flp/PilA